MNIILFGGPGAGKGTQAQKIAEHYRICHISTGDMLRAVAQETTPLAQEIKTVMQRGELVSDEQLRRIVVERLKKDDCKNGFMLDGYPRTIAQAYHLNDILGDLNKKLDVVLYIEVDEKELITRLSKRGRADDNEETIKNRLKVYESATKSILDYYKKAGSLKVINGVGAVDAIFNSIKNVLNDYS